MQPTLAVRLAPAPHVVSQILPDEAVIIVPRQGEVKVLNAVGAYIWSLIDGQRTVADLAAAVCAAYEVELPRAQADTLAFVSDLLRRNMLVVPHEPPASSS